MKKKILLSAAFTAVVLIGLAQVPDAFNYQAVVRNSSGEVLTNQNVSFRISILQGSESGAVLYSETHTVSTNAFGLANLKIGKGTFVSGLFSPGGWGATSHFIKVEIDPAGGSAYTHLGTSALLSVPYAFHAQTVQTDNVDDADADPTNELQTISLVGSDLTLSDGGGTITLPSSGAGDNWGTQTVESDATLSGDGTSGDPLGVVGDLTDDQTLSILGQDLSISGGNTVTLPVDDWGSQVVESDATLSGDGTSGDPLGVVGDLTDDQTLTLVGNDLSITDGNTVTIPGDDWGAQVVESDATLSGDGTSGDPLGVIGDLTDDQTLTVVGNDLLISGGNTVTLPGDDWGAQVVVGNATLSGNGTSGSPLGVVGDLTDDQTLSLSGDNLSISNGNTVNIGGADNQTLSVSGFNLSISNGNSVPIPTIWSLNGNRAYYNAGNVGVGTSTPVNRLHLSSANVACYQTFHNSTTGTAHENGLLIGTYENRAYLWNWENGPLRFATNGTARMHIDANGNIGIGTETPQRLLDVHGGSSHGYMGFHTNTSGSGSTDGLLVGISGGANQTYFWNYENGPIFMATNGLIRMTLEAGGNVIIGNGVADQKLTVLGNASKSVGGALWATYSDSRLKDLHGNYTKGLSEIVTLQPVVFNYKADNPLNLPNENIEYGLIAQEVQDVFPEAVSENQDGYLQLNMNPINVAFVNAIKELKEENDILKDKVDRLESRLAEIEKMLQR